MGGGLTRAIANRAAANCSNSKFKVNRVYVAAIDVESNSDGANFLAVNPVMLRLVMGDDVRQAQEHPSHLTTSDG